jgi:DNA-binding winged helix-turn-helix (wHTH) protein
MVAPASTVGTHHEAEDFVLGPWLIQPSLGIVARGDVPIHFEPKTMEVLVYLAQHAGSVVSKEELLHSLWPETFVSEHVLTHAIWQIRHLLGDRDIIQTIPRHGYRLAVAHSVDTPTEGAGSEAQMLIARSALAESRNLARVQVAAVQSGYAVMAALLVVSFGRTAVIALDEETMFSHHAKLLLLAALWLMAIYSFVTITAALMWLDRRRCFAAFDRWFAIFCPLNLLSGLFLVAASGDGLYWVLGSIPALVVWLLVLPFLLYAPFYQRRVIRRKRLGSSPV